MPKRGKSSKKDPRVRVAHVMDSIKAIESYVAGMSMDEFAKDSKTQDAVYRRLEIIGEAVKALDAMAPDLLARHPDVPWNDVKGMREKLAHDYDTISVRLLWNTATQELPALRQTVEKLIAEIDKSDL
ncbi:MAG: DUF86 domain-containing protein [Kiloniellaceae bacterium]